MNSHPPSTKNTTSRILKKLALSAFVIGSFTLYAIEKSFSGGNGSAAGAQPPDPQVSQLQLTPTPAAPALDSSTPTDVPPAPALPTDTPPPTAGAAAYKDGTYVGSQVDAFYGIVQVQTVIKNGKIAGVQFLKYPSDRRTSVRINDFAMPYLQQEALQVQNANVDIISGATLTSEAFSTSLQSTLDKAKG